MTNQPKPTFIINSEMKEAIDLVLNTNTNVYLTGRAGTGKTTLLRYILGVCKKNTIIAAPTGVAAINAGGVTLHSLLKLPFSPYKPAFVRGKTLHVLGSYKLNDKQVETIQKLELLVIDEISMVRADLLDAVNDALCFYRNTKEPFGGVQLLLIGDLYQLPPVTIKEEWGLVEKYYDSPYFFCSKALKTAGFKTVSLSHVFRQSDEEFLHLLNEVRNGNLSAESRKKLLELYDKRYIGNKESGYITLCATNKSAQNINMDNLARLEGEIYRYDAILSGDFPENAAPCEPQLNLKVGAQVMFCANDQAPMEQRKFYNGMLGVVEEIINDDLFNYVAVRTDKGEKIIVTKYIWKNVKYECDAEGKIVAKEIGSCTQYPLKLAWAITIHKSQGLTFDKVIVDAGRAFAHGQVYVALSRCRTLEGIKLISKITDRQIICDRKILEIEQNQ